MQLACATAFRDGAIKVNDIEPERNRSNGYADPAKSHEPQPWMRITRFQDQDIAATESIGAGFDRAKETLGSADAVIARAGELAGPGVSIVKVAKPKQDMRFDVPTVGVTTIQNLHRAGGKYLAIEAGKTILLNEAETLDIADQLGICIVALQDAQIGANDRKLAS